MRERLPGGEVQHVGAREHGIQRRTQRFGATAGRGDDQHRAGLTRGATALDEARDDGGVEAIDEGEGQVAGCRGSDLTIRLSLLERANDPGNCHSDESTRGLRHRAGRGGAVVVS